ncbi:AsmA-like C-terminal region-containing protein [Shimia biformata]|uniref:AsmA-like C-terminal region-containing protein n=1 Tax=Shimia biformata TaxID=1294299 RepID=UPI00194FAC9B|nr:AsmA-like C-terminal region-containing protein [Shimia biformata]
MRRGAIWAGAVVLLLLVVLPWLVLESAMFSKLRRDLVSRALSEELKIPVIIDGDVSVSLSRRLRFSVVDAHIPSTTMPDRITASLGAAQFSVPLAALLEGRFPIQDLVVRDLDAEAYRDSAGRTSWTQTGGLFTATGDNGKPKSNLLRVFYDKRIDIQNIRLKLINDQSGFDFLFDLQAFLLDYTGSDNPVTLTSHGAMNGQPFEVTGDFPRGADFSIAAMFGRQQLDISGAPYRDGVTDGFGADITLTSPDLQGFLDLVALKGDVEGSGRLSFALDHRPGVIELDRIDLGARTGAGRSLMVRGRAGNLLTLDGIDLATDLRLVEDAATIPPAQRLRDIRVLRVTADILGSRGQFELAAIDAHTNAFDTELDQIGPARVGKLFRAEDGRLELTGIRLQSGDPADPFLVAEGQILDLLALKAFRFEGQLNGHADMIFPDISPEDLDELGRVQASFALSDESGVVALERLVAESTPSDLWRFRGQARVADLTRFRGASLAADMSVTGAGAVLQVLGLPDSDIGTVALELGAEAEGSDITMFLGLDVDGTTARLDLSHLETARKNILRGALFSPAIDLDGLLGLIRSGVDMAKANRQDSHAREQPSLMQDRRVPKPLIVAPDGRAIKPLVVQLDPGRTMLLRVLRRLDLEFGIKVDHLTGNDTFSGIDSRVVMNRGKLSAGPLTARVAGAHVTLGATSDVILDPGTLHVDGTMSGLSLSRVLRLLRIDMDASGKIGGSFGVALDLGRDVPLLRRTTGWARFDMKNGEIATSLIDLAGLGVFPWLFSGRAGRGRAPIACLVAPVTVNNGTFSSNQVVLETDAVQVILKGKINIPANQIALRGEPRPATRPLARSAFPFEVTGKLTKPDVSIVRAGGESREKRGVRTVVQNHQPCRVYQLDPQ